MAHTSAILPAPDLAPAARDADQRDTIAFLACPGSYGGDITAVERIDTHISSVFLAGRYAYKLKHAIRFSYVDFSTVARREATCRAELALNTRTAPGIYLGVRSITREPDGSLAFGGAGIVLDWVVVMLRFEQDALFDRLAANGKLDASLVERLAVEVADFHRHAERIPARHGRAALAAIIDGNELNLALASPVLSTDACARIVRRWRLELDRCEAMLDRRSAAGKLRRCHGDLHLRNIFLRHAEPTLFDCIEFSDDIACIDVLYDLAFLLMDLQHRKLETFGNLIFNTYLDANDEADGVAALPLMMSLRAGIRAHTGCAAARSQPDAMRRDASIAEARAYLSLAETLLGERPPSLVAIGGFSGSGKSTLARTLAPELGRIPGARLLHTDALRKRLFGVGKNERLEAAAYRPEVSDRVYATQREQAATYVRAGYSAIVDGVFALARERDAIATTARACAASFTALWLTAPDDVLRERVRNRSNDMSDATLTVLEAQLHGPTASTTWIPIDASGDRAASADLARAALDRATGHVLEEAI